MASEKPAADNRPVRVAIIGLGGFAQLHHRTIFALEREGLCRLAAACDPAADQFGDFCVEMEFVRRNIAVHKDYRSLLAAHAAELDLVTIPTPIQLHAEMHRAVIESGLTAYLEKPPSLDLDEFDRMLAVDCRAPRPTIVGFQMISDPARRNLKRRLVNGEFGRVCRVSFIGLWPRSNQYFLRNAWAGRLMLDGRLVLDSCFGNAMAHYLNNCCHWAADDAVDAWRSVESLEAELYRAHPIEGPDTLFARGRFQGGTELRLALTHASSGASQQREIVECERATIEFIRPDKIHIYRPNAEPEILNKPAPDPWNCAFRDALAYVAGRSPRPGQILPETAPFVRLNALTYLAARRIRNVTPPHAITTRGAKGDILVAIENIAETAETFLRDGRFPTEQGLPWAPAAAFSERRTATVNDLAELRSVVERLAAERAAESDVYRAY